MADVGGALESIRVQAVNRLRGNKRFRELNMATVELLLPRDSRKVWMSTHHKNDDARPDSRVMVQYFTAKETA